jgi:hypothetical protein
VPVSGWEWEELRIKGIELGAGSSSMADKAQDLGGNAESWMEAAGRESAGRRGLWPWVSGEAGAARAQDLE